MTSFIFSKRAETIDKMYVCLRDRDFDVEVNDSQQF